MKKTIRQIDRALKTLYDLNLPEKAETFITTKAHSIPHKSGELLIKTFKNSDDIELGIYLNPSLYNDLSHPKPFEKTHSFCVATEEVSHFLLYLFHAHQGKGVSQLELEFQAEVDKFLVLYFSKVREAPTSHTLFDEIFEKLFVKVEWDKNLSPEDVDRYQTAHRLAVSFLQKNKKLLTQSEHERLLKLLRKFYRLNKADKLSAGLPSL